MPVKQLTKMASDAERKGHYCILCKFVPVVASNHRKFAFVSKFLLNQKKQEQLK